MRDASVVADLVVRSTDIAVDASEVAVPVENFGRLAPGSTKGTHTEDGEPGLGVFDKLDDTWALEQQTSERVLERTWNLVLDGIRNDAARHASRGIACAQTSQTMSRDIVLAPNVASITNTRPTSN